jgi:pimeloyl-ACP methyl ester carboxylesterase
MNVIKNHVIDGSRNKPILLDVFYSDREKQPVVIFCHGFKGFKDWGHFNTLGKRFSFEGIMFVKFNFSFNGTTPDDPEVFGDLEAFGNNNYSTELNDLGLVIDWVTTYRTLSAFVDPSRIFLLGHSRGGGVAILKAAEDKRIKKLAMWASVSDFLHRNKKKTIETWEKEGVVYTTNARTGQRMPLYYQFYLDMLHNPKRLDINAAAHSLKMPVLIVHGSNDEAVPVQEAENLRRIIPHAELLLVQGAGHTFGIKHPFAEGPFPGDAEMVIFKTIEFFKS